MGTGRQSRVPTPLPGAQALPQAAVMAPPGTRARFAGLHSLAAQRTQTRAWTLSEGCVHASVASPTGRCCRRAASHPGSATEAEIPAKAKCVP